MKVIILGCGRVGSSIANLLDSEGHQVAVIDKDPYAFERLKKDFRGLKIVGLGFDRETLEKAGIREADAFVAAAKGDNHNAVSAFIARNYFGVPKVIARIYDSERARIYWKMGITTIAPVSWAVNEIRDFLLFQEISARVGFGAGEVKLVECSCSGHLAGRTVSEVDDGKHIRFVALVRRGHAQIPPPGFILEESDMLILAVDDIGMQKLNEVVRG